MGIPGLWKLEAAKAAFSEVVRKAQSEGPQHVTVRGKEACVIVSAEDFRKLSGLNQRPALADFLKDLDLKDIDVARPQAGWRDDPS
jgi:antitoxin Phd